jgi:hypothetical protein
MSSKILLTIQYNRILVNLHINKMLARVKLKIRTSKGYFLYSTIVENLGISCLEIRSHSFKI